MVNFDIMSWPGMNVNCIIANELLTSNLGWLGQKIKILSFEFLQYFLHTLKTLIGLKMNKWQTGKNCDESRAVSCNHSRFLCVQWISCNNCRINLILSQLFLICSLFYPVSNFSAVKTYGQILSLSAEFEKYLSLFCISTCPVQFSACPGSWWVQGHSLSSTSHNKLEIFSKVYSRFDFQL